MVSTSRNLQCRSWKHLVADQRIQQCTCSLEKCLPPTMVVLEDSEKQTATITSKGFLAGHVLGGDRVKWCISHMSVPIPPEMPPSTRFGKSLITPKDNSTGNT